MTPDRGGVTLSHLDLVRRLASPVARTWVCATVVEAGLLHTDQLDDLLDWRAAVRLRRRYG